MIVKRILIGLSILLLWTSTLSAESWDKADKILFGTVCGLQLLDGITTINHLNSNENNYISNTWNWKYGCRRPSSEHLWLVKIIELGGSYIIANKLSPKYRKGFLTIVGGLLGFCVIHNLKIGAGFGMRF